MSEASEARDGERIADAVLPLLQEYTQRLRIECDEYLKVRPSKFITPLGISVGIVAVIAAALQLDWRSFPHTLRDFEYILMLFLGVVILLTATRAAFLTHRTNILIRHQIRTTAARLEKVVRVGSQLEDHGIEDVGTRMQLQLRLADGEAALELFSAVFDAGITIQSVEIGGMKIRVGRDDAAQSAPTSAANVERLRERHS